MSFECPIPSRALKGDQRTERIRFGANEAADATIVAMQSVPPDDLDPRVALAAERTLLAWIRTGIALMGFGFVVAKFGLFVRALTAASGDVAAGTSNASATGVALVGAGVALNIWASVRHVRMLGRLARGERDVVGPRGPVSVGFATAIGGLVLLAILLGAFFR